MKRTTQLLFLISITVLVVVIMSGCSKEKDYGYLNTDRRPTVTIISERFTNPPKINADLTWKPYKIVYYTLDRDVDYRSYEGLPPDTLFSTCSIDKIDSLFKVEIVNYKVQKY